MRPAIASLLGLAVLLAGQAGAPDRPTGAPLVQLPSTIRSFDLVTPTWGWVLSGDRLYRTEDAGSRWTEITPQGGAELLPCAARRLAAAAFAGPRAGMALLLCSGPAGVSAAAWARTADGGRSWSLGPLPAEVMAATRQPSGGLHLQAVDARTALLVVDALTSSNFSHGRLFVTGDGGQTWRERSLPAGGPVAFSSPTSGWAGGGCSGRAPYHTSDGGLTWRDVALAASPDAANAGRGTALYQIPLVSGEGPVLLPVRLPQPHGSVLRLYLAAEDGEAWQLLAERASEGEALPGVAVPVAALGAGRWLVRPPGSDALLRIEPPQGSAPGWSVTPVGRGTAVAAIQALDMAGDRVGWALARSGACDPVCRQETELLRTTDGGASWARTLIGASPERGAAGPLAGARDVGGATPGAAQGPRTRWVSGHGFDTCEAPSLAALQAWIDHSPYRTMNLYIGGVNRACQNARLEPGYVESLAGQGWTFVPTWVGPQAACWGYAGAKMSYDPQVAYLEGRAEAEAAASAATDLGLAAPGSGTVIYYDLEAYNTGNTPCRQAALAFIQGWTERLQSLGHVAGAYGAGCASAPSDWATLPSPPEALWAAHWIHDGFCPEVTVWDVACLSNSLWPDHQRLRQYTGGHNEVWGTTNLTIDCDVLDGIVADTRERWSCDPDGPCWFFYLPDVLSR